MFEQLCAQCGILQAVSRDVLLAPLSVEKVDDLIEVVMSFLTSTMIINLHGVPQYHIPPQVQIGCREDFFAHDEAVT